MELSPIPSQKAMCGRPCVSFGNFTLSRMLRAEIARSRCGKGLYRSWEFLLGLLADCPDCGRSLCGFGDGASYRVRLPVVSGIASWFMLLFVAQPAMHHLVMQVSGTTARGGTSNGFLKE